MCFMNSFNFSANLEFKNFKRIDIPNLVVKFFEGTFRSSNFQIVRPCATVQMLLVTEMWPLLSFVLYVHRT